MARGPEGVLAGKTLVEDGASGGLFSTGCRRKRVKEKYYNFR
jgi:hypothetical protein